MYLLLLLLWVVFNGRITIEILLLGIAICGWLYWFMCKYMGYTVKGEKEVLRRIPGILKYIFILVKEIIASSVGVMKIILSPKMEHEPVFVEFETDLKQTMSRVTLANSITLTPGTYTIRLEENVYLIHGLDAPFGEGLGESVFVKELRKLEG